MEIFFLLFGVAAMLIITDMISSSNDEDTALANGEEAEGTEPGNGEDAPGLGPQFGDPDAGPPDGTTLDIDDEFARFVLDEGYAGGGTLSLPAGFEDGMIRAGIDISALTEDADFVLDRDGNFTLTVGDLPPTLINLAIGEITLGKGDDTVDLRRTDEDDFDPEGVIVNAAEGTNKIDFGRDLAGVFNLSGGDNTVLAKGATVTITGGDNTLINSKLSSTRAFWITLEPNADSDTIVEGARVNLTVAYTDMAIAESREFEADRAINFFNRTGPYELTWDGGSFETEMLRWVTEDFSGVYDPTLPAGVERVDPPADQISGSPTFVLTDDFIGGGTIEALSGVIDTSGLDGNVIIEADPFGQPLLRLEGQDFEPTLLKGSLLTVKLASGNNLVTAQNLSLDIEGGENTIENDSAELMWVTIDGGVNDLTQRRVGAMLMEISAGDNTVFIGNRAAGEIWFTEEATGDTVIRGGSFGALSFYQPGPDVTLSISDAGVDATWQDGSAEFNARRDGFVIVKAFEGATIDLSGLTDSMDYELRLILYPFNVEEDGTSVSAETTFIGEPNDKIDIRNEVWRQTFVRWL